MMSWTFLIRISKLTLHTPQATVHSSLVALAWFAWHSMQRSIMWLRQIAQLSTTISEKEKRIVKLIALDSELLDIQTAGSFSWLWVINWFSLIYLTPSPESNSIPLKTIKGIAISNVIDSEFMKLRYLTKSLESEMSLKAKQRTFHFSHLFDFKSLLVTLDASWRRRRLFHIIIIDIHFSSINLNNPRRKLDLIDEK